MDHGTAELIKKNIKETSRRTVVLFKITRGCSKNLTLSTVERLTCPSRPYKTTWASPAEGQNK